MSPFDGNGVIVAYLKAEKQFKRLPASMSVLISDASVAAAEAVLGEGNVRIREVSLRPGR